MTPRRSVSLVLAVVATAMLVTGSAGFTSVSADRSVSVSVVDAENAYVAVDACEKSTDSGNGSNPVRVTVKNQFSEPFTVERISSDADTKEPDTKNATVGPGDSATFNAAFGEEELTVSVSGGVDATVTATIESKATCGDDTNGTADGTATETAGTETS